MNGRNRQITYNMGGREVLGFMTGRKRVRGSEFFGVLAIACLLAILMAGPAQALPLYLNLNPYPDIFSGLITTDYDAGADTFTANGMAIELNDGGVGSPHAIVGGSFALTAIIDGSGVLGTGGALTIGGTVGTVFTSGTLLTGNLIDFGWYEVVASETFEFLFDVTGGDAAGLYGSTGLVLLHNSGFPGNFALDFWASGGDTAIADTGTPIPEPASMLLLLAGLIGLAGFRRKIKK